MRDETVTNNKIMPCPGLLNSDTCLLLQFFLYLSLEIGTPKVNLGIPLPTLTLLQPLRQENN